MLDLMLEKIDETNFVGITVSKSYCTEACPTFSFISSINPLCVYVCFLLHSTPHFHHVI